MVEIKIIDPSASDLPALRALVKMLEGATATISPLDHPSTGRDVIGQVWPTPTAVFDKDLIVGTMSRDVEFVAPYMHASLMTATPPDPNEVFGKADSIVQASAQLASGEHSSVAEALASLPDPADVFGKSPLPNGVTDAPSIAVAGPSTTAPGGTSAILTAPTANLIPAPPSAPTAPTVAHQVPPAPHAPGVELDANRLPWDARIHASSRAKVANGTWRMKKNVAPELVKRVEAELRAVLAIPGAAPAVAVPPPPVELGNVPPPPGGTPPAPTSIAPAPPVAAASPTVAETATAAAPGSITTFPQLAEKITSALIGGLATQPEFSAILSKCGFQSLPLVASRPDLIPTVAAKIDEFLAAKAKL